MKKRNDYRPFSYKSGLSLKICHLKGRTRHGYGEKHHFTKKKISSRFHFVAAAEEKAEPQRLVSVCHKQRIPVNAVVQPAQCDFLFFALISTDRLCGGVSTGGASPTQP